MKTCVLYLIAIWAVVLCSTAYGAEPAELAPHVGWTTGVLTNASLDQMEVRVGYELDADWELGLLGTWFTNDYGARSTHSSDGTTTTLADLCEMASDGDDGGRGATWGLGGYLKLAVDPDASLPLAGFLPAVGDWLSLPDSIICQTYLIGKLQVVPYDGDAEIVGALGAGAQIGPAVIEWVYNLVEQGETGHPALASGAELFFGARLEF